MYLIIILLFIIFVWLILLRTHSKDILRLSFWLFVAYSFLLITHLFSGIKYNAGSLTRIMPYFLFCLFLIIVGEMFGSFISSPNFRHILKISLKKLCILSLIGSSILIFDMLRLNNINFGFRIEGIRTSSLSVIGTILSSLGILAWLNSLYEFRINKLKIPFVAYLAAISYISGGLLNAGRAALIIILISTIIMILWSSKKRKESQILNTKEKARKINRPILLYVLLFLALNYFLLISNIRSGISNVDVKISQFEKGFNAKTSEQTIKDVHNIGPFSHIYLEALYYYSHELRRLDIFFQNYDYPPLFGLSQMGYVERRLNWIIGDQETKSWNEVVDAVERKGRFNSHTWGTFITNFIMDFGRFGALIACFILGVFVGILFKSFKKKESSFTVVRQVLICAGIAFSIQVSPVSELIWMVPFVFSSFIHIIPLQS